MTDLPDVNLWLALVDENHPHHTNALHYWEKQSAAEIAFCRVTSLGFFRLSTYPKVLSRPLTTAEAWDIYQRYRNEAGVGFVEDCSEVDTPFMSMSLMADFPHHLWTDCYLAALSKYLNCRLVSFDADFKRFTGLNFLHLGP